MPETESRRPVAARLAAVFSRTTTALAAAVRRRDSGLVLLAASAAYFLVYLYTVGDLSFATGETGSLSVRTADDYSRAFASLGFFRFAAVAVLSAGPVTYLFSPLNVLVAVVLSGLVGANLALTYLGLVQPRACGLEASTGVLAGVPALLSGAACCGPAFLVVVGVQASATLLTAFQVLVPVAIGLLVAGLLLVGRKVDPALL